MKPFVAFDFETANEKRASACSIGLAKFDESGRLVDTFASLILPHESLRYFNPVNTWTHGLSMDDVADSLEWNDINESVQAFVEDLPLVAHNMAFDGYVVNDLATLYGLESPLNDRICTLRISRALLSERLPSRKLPAVFAHYFPDDIFNHHDAAADAIAAGKVFTAMQTEFDYARLCEAGIAGAGRRRVCRGSKGSEPSSTIENLMTEFDNKPLLEGETVCITGTLNRGKRDEIYALISRLGGTPAKSLTRKTTLFVVGIPNPQSWNPEAKGSAKLLKATELRHKGAPIEVLSEEAFFDRLDELNTASSSE